MVQWSAREYIDMPDETATRELTVTKRGRHAHLRLHRARARQSGVGINCCYWATWGAMFAPIFPLLAWDVTWNEGVARPIRLIAPEGTVVNCRRPAPISIATVGTVQIVNNLSTLRALEDVRGQRPLPRSCDGRLARQPCACRDPRHQRRGRVLHRAADRHVRRRGRRTSVRRRRRPRRGDPERRLAVGQRSRAKSSIRRFATSIRRVVPDSGGPGKLRGGVCHEYAFTPHGLGDGSLGVVLFGKGTRAPMSLGIFGGYPGCNVGYITFRNGNVDELPESLEETPARASGRPVLGPRSALEAGDIQYVRFMGGGGYGDPIDRDPQAVLRDVDAAGWSRVGAARDIYGVVLDVAASGVDEPATRARRLEIRSERTGGSVIRSDSSCRCTRGRACESANTCNARRTGRPSAHGVARRSRRQVRIGRTSRALRASPLSRAGPHRPDSDEFRLIEACCPGCGTLLEVELAAVGDSPLHDRIESWPNRAQ